MLVTYTVNGVKVEQINEITGPKYYAVYTGGNILARDEGQKHNEYLKTLTQTHEFIAEMNTTLLAGSFTFGEINFENTIIDIIFDEKIPSNIFKVGLYQDLRKLGSEFDAHHVGQKKIMSNLIPGYNPNFAPAILVPDIGHTLTMPGIGIVSRNTKKITNVRQLVARDILELRRVYSDIPNSSLQDLIDLNKKLYPGYFIK